MLTNEEFTDRLIALQEATKIFIETGLTDNISKAFAAYEEVVADRERKIFITKQDQPFRFRPTLTLFNLPKCPDCSADMIFRQVPENPDKIQVQLLCTKCDLGFNENDVSWWMKSARDKSAVQEHLKELKRINKNDEMPGIVDVYLDDICPNCGKEKLRIYKPCCGSPMGYKGCPCGYRTDKIKFK